MTFVGVVTCRELWDFGAKSCVLKVVRVVCIKRTWDFALTRPYLLYAIFDKNRPLSYFDLFEWSSSSLDFFEACGVFLEIESILFRTNIDHKGLQRTADEYAAESRIY